MKCEGSDSCVPERNGFGSCMSCLKATDANDVKYGHVSFESGPIESTGPQCQVKVHVKSKGTDLGLWKVIVKDKSGNEEIVASMYGAYPDETNLIAQVPNKKDVTLMVVAQQWTNMTGEKAIGSIAFEFCAYTENKDKQDFKCENGKYVSYAVVCDLVDDCGDSSDESVTYADCGFRNEHCLYPDYCKTSSGWNPIAGRLIPQLSPCTDTYGFVPKPPKVSGSLENVASLPLIVDLSTKLRQSDDTFQFDLPEIDAVRDTGSNYKCWFRFHYYVPSVMHDVDIRIVNNGDQLMSRLQAVASNGWIREQLELPLYDYEYFQGKNASLMPSVYKPKLIVRLKDQFPNGAKISVGVNGVVAFWGLSFSQHCRLVYSCPEAEMERHNVDCREHDLSCKAKTIAPASLVSSLLKHSDGIAKDFCYPPLSKCDAKCDCVDCRDEQDCGGTCSFEYPENCGWITGDNWLWPSKVGELCNSHNCIVTAPDTFYTFIPSSVETFHPNRALLSKMHLWMSSESCQVDFSYRLWPGTSLDFVLITSNGTAISLWSKSLESHAQSVLSWTEATVNMTSDLRNFRMAFVPTAKENPGSMIKSQPVGLAKIKFSDACYKEDPKAPVCELPPYVCKTGQSTASCVEKVEQPLRCGQTLVACEKDSQCNFALPRGEQSSEPQVKTTEIVTFAANDQYCNRASCFLVLNYDLHNTQDPSSYLSVAFEEFDDDFGSRRQQIWRTTADDFNKKNASVLARIPFNYCPTDLKAGSKRTVELQLEATTGSKNLEIHVNSLEMSSNCFTDNPHQENYPVVCSDDQFKCASDHLCYPKRLVCFEEYGNPQYLSKVCHLLIK